MVRLTQNPSSWITPSATEVVPPGTGPVVSVSIPHVPNFVNKSSRERWCCFCIFLVLLQCPYTGMVDTDIAVCVVSVIALLLPVCSRPGKLFPLLSVCKPRELSRFPFWVAFYSPFIPAVLLTSLILSTPSVVLSMGPYACITVTLVIGQGNKGAKDR